MPIYEYACPDCGHKFDEIQKFSDDPITVCPKCGKNSVKKLISQTSFILKGGGWYKDHYGLKPGGAEGKSEGTKPEGTKSEGSAAEGSKSEGPKSEGSKSEGSKSEGSPATPAAAPAAAAPSAPSTSGSTSSST